MNSEPIKLKFKLGSQLENWEFDLSTLREYIQDEISYEVYEYIGNEKSFLGVEPDKIELTFNADILVKVEYYFKVEMYAKLLSKLEQKLSKPAVSNTLLTSWYYKNYRLTMEKLPVFKIIRVDYKRLTKNTKG